MTSQIRILGRRWQEDDRFRALAGAAGSLAVTALFALYNGYLGLRESSPWNGSICVYYLLLTALRGYILGSERGRAGADITSQRRALAVSSGALVALNLALIAPISLMALMERPVSMGLTPAIATAAYATWKVASGVVSFRKRRRDRDPLVRQLRAIRLVDALVSVLTLQNTLIMVNMEGDAGSMRTLVAVSSLVVFLIINAISISNLLGARRGASPDKGA